MLNYNKVFFPQNDEYDKGWQKYTSVKVAINPR
jgi:hypothetical protein